MLLLFLTEGADEGAVSLYRYVERPCGFKELFNAETQEVIDARMSRAYEESLGVENYDYLVINDDLDACVELVHDIIQKERANETEVHADNRISANLEFINNMRKELLSFSKGV